MDPLAEQAHAALTAAWPALARTALAWARLAPVVLLVPAFGLRAVIAPVRVALGLAMALAVSPAIDAGGPPVTVTAWRLAVAGLEGLPVALTAAAALHAATMAGGIADTLRGDRAIPALPNLSDGASPLGTLLGVLVAIAFLEAGGAAELCRQATAVTGPPVPALLGAARALRNGIAVAVAAATPLLVVSVVVEVAFALTARAASPAHVTVAVAPARSLVVLGATAVVLDRVVELLVLFAQSGTR